ncbi:SDR family oxidoreductase [Bacteroides fragilis]|nr:SDR family oxidoreductase [Bacteroides fragilis]MCY6340182.1 SDR family oxidoreductase [Bacteroides fragilis]
MNRNVYAGEHGTIVLISSVYGLVGSAANVGYALSKGAIQGITKALSIELAPKKVRVNCIAPGFIKTKMMENVSSSFSEDYVDHLSTLHPLGLGEAEDVANSVLFLLSDMSKWITGAIISVDGGFTAQ